MRRQDPLYSLRLVEIVEKYPCLYDFNLSEYNFRDITNSAWEQVAEEMKDTASNCRKYWRHLRIVFARNLKKDPHGTGARSLLQEKMMFLKPFMKINDSDFASNFSPLKEEPEEILSTVSTLITENSLDNDGDVDNAMIRRFTEDFNQQYKTTTDDEWQDGRNEEATAASGVDEYKHQNYTINSVQGRKKRKIYEPNSYNSFTKTSSTPEERQENYRRHYLISLLPDLEEMNSKQFRHFRRKVDELIAEIL